MGGFVNLLRVFNTSLGILGTLSLLIGVFLMQDSLNHKNLPNHVRTNCTLNKFTVVKLPETCGYITLWGTENGLTAIDDPLSSDPSKTSAISRTIDYPLNTDLTCYCPKSTSTMYPNLSGFDGCGIWNVCVLEYRMAEHIQNVGLQYMYLSEFLLAFSSLSVLACLILSIVSCCCGNVIQQCFNDCSCSDKNKFQSY